MSRRVLLLGASGVFGSRLAERLMRVKGVTLVLTARRRAPLEALADRLAAGGVRPEVAVVERSRLDFAALTPWLVIDASGPFQGQDYACALATVQAGAHWIDLADSRAYVAGFAAAVGPAAQHAGVAAYTGASSTPALSHAALDALTAGWRRVDTVATAIMPGARAPKGLAVIRAILSWAGRPMRVLEDGRWRTRAGWSGLRRRPVPGLGWRWLSWAETPDLDLLAERFRPERTARMEAGLAPGVLHLGLATLSLGGRLKVPLVPLAVPLQRLARVFDRFGDDIGGLLAEAEGKDEAGRPVRARFVLVAAAGDGPSVPGLPAAALMRSLLAGPHAPGASVCAGVLPLDPILEAGAGLRLSTRTERIRPDEPGVVRRALGGGYAGLPAAVREAHDGRGVRRLTGRAAARGGPLAAPICRLLGLPDRPGPVGVEITPGPPGVERWVRRFGQRRFATRLTACVEGFGFEEHAGPLSFRFDVDPLPHGFCWRLIGWRFGPIGLPLTLAPRVRSRTFARGGLYRFSVVVAHPWLGVVFAYAGWLQQG